MIKTTVDIEGMMCGMCEAHINDAIRNAFKIKKVTSSHSKGKTIIISETPPDSEKLKSVIDATRYKVKEIKSEEKSGGFLAGLFGKL